MRNEREEHSGVVLWMTIWFESKQLIPMQSQLREVHQAISTHRRQVSGFMKKWNWRPRLECHFCFYRLPKWWPKRKPDKPQPHFFISCQLCVFSLNSTNQFEMSDWRLETAGVQVKAPCICRAFVVLFTSSLYRSNQKPVVLWNETFQISCNSLLASRKVSSVCECPKVFRSLGWLRSNATLRVSCCSLFLFSCR